MTTPLRVLVVEDNAAEVELIILALRQGGYAPAWERVQDEADYAARLLLGWDVILAKLMMPSFTGERALELLQERGLDVPFIFISASVGEAGAVGLIKKGAADCLTAACRSRLAPAVCGALEQHALRRKHSAAIECLRKNAAFVEAALDLLAAEVVVIDGQGKIRATNEAWRAFARENGGQDCFGHNYLDVCSLIFQRCANADAGVACEGIKAVLAALLPVFSMEYPCHSRAVRRWFQMRVSPLRGVAGGAVIAHEEITERKQAEAASRLFRNLVDRACDTIEVIDPETARFIDVNESGCRSLGYSREEYLQLRVWDVDGLVDAAMWLQIRERIRTSGLCREGLHRRKDGTTFPVELNAKWVTLDRDYIVATVRNITERSRAEAEVRKLEREREGAFEANRLKNEFLATMSHELRTPLNAIIGYTEMLVDERVGPVNALQREYLGDVHAGAQHLRQLISDVLDLARIEAGKVEFTPEQFAPAAAIEGVCAGVQKLALKGEVTLHQIELPTSVEVELDLVRFKQICFNLLSNAIKFTLPGGRVEIRLAPHGDDHFTLQVIDTGIGIKENDLLRLFRQFEQIEGGLARRYDGSGLGLALTKKLVEAQAGSIAVQSEYGRGSTFTVTLPRRMGGV